MKFRSFFILALLAVGMGLYLYFGIEKGSKRELELKEKTSKIISFDTAQVTDIEIKNRLGATQLKKESGEWRGLSPFKDLASQAKIEELLKKIDELTIEQVIHESSGTAVDLSQFGLTEPRFSIRLKRGETDAGFLIEGGSESPLGTGQYIKTDKGVLLVGSELDYLQTQASDDYREGRLVSVDASDFVDVTIETGKQKLRFERGESGAWRMTSPYTLPMDDSAVKDLIDKVSFIRANRFESTKPSGPAAITIQVSFAEGVTDRRSYDGDKRQAGIELKLFKIPQKSKSRQELSSADNGQFQYWATTDKLGESAQIAQFHFDSFIKRPEDFVKRTFDDFLFENVTQIKMISNAGAIRTVERNESNVWHENNQTVDRSTLESMVGRVRNLRASSFEGLQSKEPQGALGLDLQLHPEGFRSYRFLMTATAVHLYFRSSDTSTNGWRHYVLPKAAVEAEQIQLTNSKATSQPKHETNKP